MKSRFLVILALALGVSVWMATRSGAPLIRESGADSGKPLTAESTGAANTGHAPLENANESTRAMAVPDAKWQAIQWETVADIMSAKTAGRDLLTDAQVEEFLRKHGATAINLIAAWECTRKRQWLEQALEKFPNDPVVLATALSEVWIKAGRLELIERFKRVASDNPVPWIFSAEQLFQAGRSAGALAELRAALEKPGFYIYQNERIAAAHRLYLDTGLDPIGAEFLAISQLPLDHLSVAMRITRGLNTTAKDPTTTPTTRREVVELYYGMGKMFSTPEASRLAIGQLVGISIESASLKLAQAEQDNPLPVNPNDRLAELDRQKALVADFTELPKRMLQKRDAALLTEYMQRLRSQGERNAIQWLKGRLP